MMTVRLSATIPTNKPNCWGRLYWRTLPTTKVCGVLVALIGVGIVTRAGQLKERKMGIKAEEFNLKKGLVLAMTTEAEQLLPVLQRYGFGTLEKLAVLG